MNRKGFTTIELILTMMVVITIMVTITSVTYAYRDRSRYEEIVTEVKDYKNKLTKIIYDDILDSSNKVIGLEKDDTIEDLFYLVRLNGDKIPLEVINENQKVGIKYNGVEYIIPSSNSSLVNYEGTTIYPTDYKIWTNGIEKEREDTVFYSLTITFSHRNLEKNFSIHFVISN